MAFDLRNFASNVGTTLSNAWNSQKRKNISTNIGKTVNTGVQNASKLAVNTYNNSKPIIQGAVKQMASSVGNAVKTNAPIIASSVGNTLKTGAVNAGNGLRGLVTNYVNSKKSMIDPRANKQILIDRQKYGVPNKTIVSTEVKTPSITPTTQPQKVGVKGIEGFTRTGSGTQYYDSINKSSTENGLHPALLAGLLFQESGIENGKVNSQPVYNENGQAVIDSKTGKQLISVDRGIAQINNIAHPEVTDAQANDPNFAIPWAAKEIAYNIKHFNGDVNRAIAAYNVGRGGANIQGPEVYGGGPKGQTYLNNLAQNLTPELQKYLGLKTGAIKSPLKK